MDKIFNFSSIMLSTIKNEVQNKKIKDDFNEIKGDDFNNRLTSLNAIFIEAIHEYLFRTFFNNNEMMIYQNYNQQHLVHFLPSI